MRIDQIKSAMFFYAVKIRGINVNYLNVNEVRSKGIEMFYNHDVRQLAILDSRENAGERWEKVVMVGSENIPYMSPVSSNGWWDIQIEEKKPRGRPPRVDVSEVTV